MDESNQNTGSVSQDVDYYLVETNLGNGIIVGQPRTGNISFHAFSPADGHEYEVDRHKLDASPDKLQQFQNIPTSHTLKFDTINNSVMAIPKKTPPQKGDKQIGA